MAFSVMGSVTVPVNANTEKGGLVWHFRDASNSALTGITAPTLDEKNKCIYVASAKQFYKLDAETGKLLGKITLSASVGYNKIAPVVADGKAFVPLGAGKLDIVDVGSMTVIKTVQFADATSHKGHQTLTPAVYDEGNNTVYLGTWRKDYGGIYAAVALDDYSVKTLVESKEGFYWSGACITDEYVVFGSTSDGTEDPNTPADGDAVLYAYNKNDGTLLETVLLNSGSICCTVVEYSGKYYYVSKSGKFYEAEIVDGQLKAHMKGQLTGTSTCTPCIIDGKAYIGSASGVEVIDLETESVIAAYGAPADVKGVFVCGDKIYCTYNDIPGGIYEVKTGRDFFVPESAMQQYCISTIAVGSDGTVYYSNDSNNVMAVREGYVPENPEPVKPTVAAQKSVTAQLIGHDDFKVKWSTQKIAGYTVKYKVQYQQYGGKWKILKSGTTGSYCTKYNLSDGVKYRFKVTPYVNVAGKTYTGKCKITGYIYTLKAVAKPSVKRISSKKATLKWKKVPGATAYKIYRASKKKGTYKYVKTVKGTSVKITAKKGTKSYYKVRACQNKINGPLSQYRYYKFK